jgi:hypothetical protein
MLPAATCLRCKTESLQGIPDPGLVITVVLSSSDRLVAGVVAFQNRTICPSQPSCDRWVGKLCRRGKCSLEQADAHGDGGRKWARGASIDPRSSRDLG